MELDRTSQEYKDRYISFLTKSGMSHEDAVENYHSDVEADMGVPTCGNPENDALEMIGYLSQ